MRKLSLAFVLFQVSFLWSQTIDSVQIFPQNPTTADSVFVITSVTMPNTGGYLGYQMSEIGQTILVQGCYYDGGMSIQETYIDTINLGLFSEGTYTINYTAYVSSSSISCDPIDSLFNQSDFTVSTALMIDEKNADPKIRVYPVPLSSAVANLELRLIKRSEVKIDLMDSQGRLVRSFEKSILESGNHNLSLDFSGITPGLYVVKLKINEQEYNERIIKT